MASKCFASYLCMRNHFPIKMIFQNHSGKIWRLAPRTVKRHYSIMTVEQAREKMVSALRKPLISGNEGKLPLSLLNRVPKDSSDMVPQVIFTRRTQMLIPLSTDIRLRDKYNSYANVLRMGRLLEDIDLCAGKTSVEHAEQLIDPATGRFPLVVVTALVDRIFLRKAILPADKDILLTGYITWVGRSSVEITVDVEQLRTVQNSSSQIHAPSPLHAASSGESDSSLALNKAEAEWDQVLQARLVMVARHPVSGKSVPFVPICARPDDVAGQQALLEGERRNKQRHLTSQQSLLKTVPSFDETTIIHELFLRTVDEQKMTFRQRRTPANAVWISETGVKTALICHVEERNAYNKVFGGYLMRQALEIAWTTVRRFAFEYPELIAIDDLVFKHPVEVGSMLFLSSFIVYHPPSTRHYVVRVNLEVITIDPNTHEEKRLVTNTAYFIYGVPETIAKLRDVFPETYADSMMYLDGKRHYEAVMGETEGQAKSALS